MSADDVGSDPRLDSPRKDSAISNGVHAAAAVTGAELSEEISSAETLRARAQSNDGVSPTLRALRELRRIWRAPFSGYVFVAAVTALLSRRALYPAKKLQSMATLLSSLVPSELSIPLLCQCSCKLVMLLRMLLFCCSVANCSDCLDRAQESSACSRENGGKRFLPSCVVSHALRAAGVCWHRQAASCIELPAHSRMCAHTLSCISTGGFFAAVNSFAQMAWCNVTAGQVVKRTMQASDVYPVPALHTSKWYCHVLLSRRLTWILLLFDLHRQCARRGGAATAPVAARERDSRASRYHLPLAEPRQSAATRRLLALARAVR